MDIVDPRDPRIEAKLIEWGLKDKFRLEVEMPIDNLRIADWAQVRDASHIGRKDDVEEYRVQMASGAVFPPVVIMEPDILIDGNTRIGAVRRLRHRTFAAYIVGFPTPAMAKAFAAAINQMGGRRLDAQEAFKAAQEMMSLNFSDEAIAREVGRSVSAVGKWRREAEFVSRIDRLDMASVVAPIPKEERALLNRIAHDPPLAEAARLIAEARPSRPQVRQLIDDVEKASDDGEALDIIHRAKVDLAPTGPTGSKVAHPTPEASEVRRALGLLLKHETTPMSLLEMGEPARSASIDRWQRVAELAEQVLNMYGVGTAEAPTAVAPTAEAVA